MESKEQSNIGGTTAGGFVIGVLVMLIVFLVITFVTGGHRKPPYRYTVQELTDAIATREANFIEKAINLEESK